MSQSAGGDARAPLYVVSIDQGTSSTRVILVDRSGKVVGSAQTSFEQHYPQAGEQWVEHDPEEIWNTVTECVAKVAASIPGFQASQVAAVGVTNQRETTVLWDALSGRPLHNAIVWLDTRTTDVCDAVVRSLGGNRDALREICGLPVTTYFSASKIRWLLDNCDAVREAVDDGRCMFGTVDSWLIYRLTGGRAHVTDVTNASRTMLMDLRTCQWSPQLLDAFGIPSKGLLLPRIASSSEVYGTVESGPLRGVPVAGCLGDQQAAMVGQLCLVPGSVKNTYGTGCFMLMNTGRSLVQSRHGLLTTAAYQLGPDQPVTYALEGSIAVAGAVVGWMRDRIGMLQNAADASEIAMSVPETGGVYFVPAFSGLFAPRWRADARGTIVGMTLETSRAHIVRAALESVCFSTREVIDAMVADSRGLRLGDLRVDGGMAANKFMMQFQADLLDRVVIRPSNLETTAMGAAVAAGLATGFWKSLDEVERALSPGVTIFSPNMSAATRAFKIRGWNRAVERSLGWVETASTRTHPDDDDGTTPSFGSGGEGKSSNDGRPSSGKQSLVKLLGAAALFGLGWFLSDRFFTTSRK